PHGQGTYTWNSGEIYEGKWKNGMRNGYGKYSFVINGKDSVQEGQWLNDEFKGLRKQPEYKVVRKLNVERYSVHKTGEGEAVYYNIMRGGTPNREIENLILSSESGYEVRQGTILGYENLTFPVTIKISYYVWNHLHTTQYNAVFEITFSQPGIYEVNLYN
ncbi:MAG: hypothetical protein JSV24_02085, partial [Bacteroidales bacterium]